MLERVKQETEGVYSVSSFSTLVKGEHVVPSCWDRSVVAWVCGGSGLLKNVTRHICSPYVSPDRSADRDLEEREEKRPHQDTRALQDMSSFCGTHQAMNSKTSLSRCQIGISVTSSKLQGFIVARNTFLYLLVNVCVLLLQREFLFKSTTIFEVFFCVPTIRFLHLFFGPRNHTELFQSFEDASKWSHGHFMRIPLEFVYSIYSLICSKKLQKDIQFSTFSVCL